MRSGFLALTGPLLLVACSSGSTGASVADAYAPAPAEDGGTGACTSLGGTCVPYTTTCPLPQQNATLCGDTVLLCCLPPPGVVPEALPDSGAAPGAEAGTPPGAEAGQGDASTDAPDA